VLKGYRTEWLQNPPLLSSLLLPIYSLIFCYINSIDKFNQVVPGQVVKACRRVEAYIHLFSTSALKAGYQLHVVAALTIEKELQLHIEQETFWAHY
jgi:hypothetical protein